MSQQHKSSPTTASSDSFSSYIYKDAVIQHRSSSPRPGEGSQEFADSPSAMGSPQPRLTCSATSVVANQHPCMPPPLHFGQPNPSPVVASQFFQDGLRIRTEQALGTDSVSSVDVRELQATLDDKPSLAAANNPVYQAHRTSVHGSSELLLSKPMPSPSQHRIDVSTSLKSEDSKADIRRRRRTKPDEANLLAAAYVKNAFPDHEARQSLADQVGMTVRAVSVWFQNRRQAEKKRSGRYGGSGISGTGGSQPTPMPSTPRDSSEAKHKLDIASIIEAADIPVTPRRPLSSTSSNIHVNRSESKRPKETHLGFSQANKENIPPWATVRGLDGQFQQLVKKTHSPLPSDANTAASGLTRSKSRDLRDLLGPSGIGLGSPERPVAPITQQANSQVYTPSQTTTPLRRNRSTPRLSLDQVLRDRSGALRRSVTDSATKLDHSSDIEDEDISTILPTPKLLSRASSSSSLSLLTTAVGRASIGSLLQPSPPSATQSVSLNSRLPAQVTAALQRQGIIAKTQDEEKRMSLENSQIWQRMESSSAASSELDRIEAAGEGNDDLKEGEEDEETTLRMVANRRTAKAQAQAQALLERDGAHSSLPADARVAINHPRASLPFLGTMPVNSHARGSISTPLSIRRGVRRAPSLDWAAGRDRSLTSALPRSITGTPFSRKASLIKSASRSQPTTTQQKARPKNGAELRDDSSPTKAIAATQQAVHFDETSSLRQGSKKIDSNKPPSAKTLSKKRPLSRFATYDENDFGYPLVASARTSNVVQQSPKRRRLENEIHFLSGLPALVKGDETPRHDSADLPSSQPERNSPLLVSRGLMHHQSFLSTAHHALSATPRSMAVLSPFSAGILQLSTRTAERFAYMPVSASPSSTSIGRSLSMSQPMINSFGSLLGRSIQSPRESSAREQMRQPFGERGHNTSRDVSRPPSQESTGSRRSASSRTSDDWATGLSKECASFPISSTPSRVLTDRTNSGLSMCLSAERSPFQHDDSGFFASASDDEQDENQPLSVGSSFKKTPKSLGIFSPATRSKSKLGIAKKQKKDGPVDTEKDRQAAELLLGLGMRRGSKSQSQ